jgi:ADP-heptose:LPS heptosyltransferase
LKDWRGQSAELHWAVRADLADWVRLHPRVDQVWPLERKQGLAGVFRLAWKLSQQKFTHVFDAHGSLRSKLIAGLIRLFSLVYCFRCRKPTVFLSRPKLRKERRVLLREKRNIFPKPFSGQHLLLRPLEKWGLPIGLPEPPLATVEASSALERSESFLVLCPASAHPLKQWPFEYFIKLIEILPNQNFVAIAGPQDHFIKTLEQKFPEKVKAHAGDLSPREVTRIFQKSIGVVSNDSGLMHLAEQIGKPCVALMGPAPFGFPARPSTLVLERNLPCRPCSKHGQGPCTNPEFQACLRQITPEEVARVLFAQILSPYAREKRICYPNFQESSTYSPRRSH